MSRRPYAWYLLTLALICTMAALLISHTGCTNSKKQAREHYLQGKSYEKEGKIQKAIDEYYSAIRLNPSSIQAHRDYQRLMLSKGQKKALIDYYGRESLNNPKNPAFFYLYGRLLDISQERLEQYDKSLALDPNFVWSIDAIGLEYMKQGKIDEAVRQFMKVIEIDSEFAPIHINLCRAFLEKKKIEAAYSEIKKYLQLEPESSDGYTELGNVYRAKGDRDGALESWQKALELDGKNTRALTSSAQVLAEKGEYDRAEEMLQKASVLSPDNPRIRYTFALIYKGQGKIREAAGEIDRAMEKDPANPLYMELNGNLAKLMGNHDKARDCFEKLLLKNAHNPRILASLADVYQKQGDLERSLSAAEGALSYDKNLADARRSLAYLLLCTGDSKGAAREYRALIAAKEDIPEDRFNLGCALMMSKQHARAVIEIKSALKREPDRTDFLLWLYFWGEYRALAQESSKILEELSKMSSGRLFTAEAQALSYCGKRRYESALKVMAKSLAEKEVDPMVALTAGIAAMGKKDITRAQAYFEKAERNRSREEGSLVTLLSLACLGELYGREGEGKKGLECLSQAENLWPPLPVRGWIEFMKARIYFGDDDERNGFLSLEKAAELGLKNHAVLEKDPLFSSLLKKKDAKIIKDRMNDQTKVDIQGGRP